MTISFVVKPDGLLAEGWDDSLADLRAAAHAWLLAHGVSAFDADTAAEQGRPRFVQVSWSDTWNGMVHDCAGHGPEDYDPTVCMADQRHVTLGCDLPPAWLGQG